MNTNSNNNNNYYYFNILLSLSSSSSSFIQIQSKIQTVQHQLQELKSHLDTETQEQYSMEEWQLTNKVMQLKEEFRELLTELRRKKLGDGSAVLSDDVSVDVLLFILNTSCDVFVIMA